MSIRSWFGKGKDVAEVGRVNSQSLGARFGIRNISGLGYVQENAIQLINEGYRANATTYACINRLVSDIAKVPLKFYYENAAGATEEVKPIAPIANAQDQAAYGNIPYIFNRRPNPFKSSDRLWGQFWRNYFITGVGAIEAVKTTTGRIQQIESPVVYELADGDIEDGRLTSYKVGLIGGTTDFRIDKDGKSDLFVFANYDPANPYKAVAPAEVCWQAIRSSNYASEYNADAIKSGMSAAGILMLKQEDGADPLSEEAIAKARENLNRILNGSANADSAQIIEAANAVWLNLNRNNREMQFTEIFTEHQRLICQAHRVPPQLIYQAATEGSTYNNLKELVGDYFRSTVVGEVETFCGELEAYLDANAPAPEGAMWRIVPQWNAVPILRDERLDRIERVSAITPGGIAGIRLTPNELREIAGFDPLPEAELDRPFEMPVAPAVTADDIGEDDPDPDPDPEPEDN